VNIAACDIPESSRRPSSVMFQRADELSDEQLVTRLGGPGARWPSPSFTLATNLTGEANGE
jgi:hypothetical protein